jgi:uncharacterized protein YegP (UPF0339 family)
MNVGLPKYQIDRSKNNQFYWVLRAINGKIVLTSSEQYTTKQNCLVSIASSKKNVADSNFDRKVSSHSQYYFLQRASGNYEELGKSEFYTTIREREEGIQAVQRDAPNANIEDLTI